jgi:hypothetical protein
MTRMPRRLVFATVSLILALLSSGCSINHVVKDDYPQYLQNNVGTSKLPSTTLDARYELTPATASHKYEFRSAMAGYANNWVVEFGQMLEATLQSKDVQGAFRKLEKRGPGEAPVLLVFDLVSYTFSDFGATVELKVTVQRPGAAPLVKTYKQAGVTQGGKMFWGGVFGMKNAIQQSTKDAVDKLLAAFITDLNALPEAGGGKSS